MKKWILLLPAIFILKLAFGQDVLPHALLWKIEGNELTKPSYLFGTIHIIPTKDYFLPKGTEEALSSSKKLFLELDMDEMNDIGTMMKMMNKLLMEDGSSLSDWISKEDHAIVEDFFEDAGLPMMLFERMKPMFLSAFTALDMNPKALSDGSMKSYEIEFAEMAKKKKMETEGLETIEFQMAIFDSIPYSVQAKMLVDGIKQSKNDTNDMSVLFEAYKQQNLNALEESIEAEDSGLSPYLDLLLKNRNASWIPLMAKQMKLQPSFFAVGAGHLAGSHGVINLLKKEGYKVTPVLN
ncbi:MAG: TraB/GumN family protein [Bacteroidota bacterium]|nr:TraB/GumN family protein [Bacteroidota bacterium]